MIIIINIKTSTYNVSLPHSKNASCPLSAFPTFRIHYYHGRVAQSHRAVISHSKSRNLMNDEITARFS